MGHYGLYLHPGMRRILTGNKSSYIMYAVLHLFRPHYQIRCLEELDCSVLLERGIRGVMLDLDNTLVPWRCQDLSPGVIAWVERMREAGLAGCIVTNASNVDRVRPVAEMLDLPWVTAAYKPFTGGLHRGMRLLGTTCDTTAMIGDLITMDILGGRRLGLFTVLVDPMSSREALATRLLQRPLERLLRAYHRKRIISHEL